MLIEVKLNEISKDGVADVDFTMERNPRLCGVRRLYYFTVLKGMYDSDNRAFLDALEMFFLDELEQDDDEK